MALKLTQSYTKHKNTVDKLYNKILNDPNEELYIKILQNSQKINDSNINEKEKLNVEPIQISLLSKSMLEYDKKIFSLLTEETLNNENDFYRPYFLEFFVDMEEISEYNKKLLIDEQKMGIWMEGTFIDNKCNDENVISIDGIIMYSASPFEMKRRTLKINKDYLNNNPKINSNFNKWTRKQYETTKSVKDNQVIEDLLKEELKNASKYSIKIYNVGDGNCIYIYTNNRKRILFDIGQNCNPYSNDWQDYYITRVQSFISRIKPHNVILSHWDLDHLVGVVFAQQCIFEIPWIAPDLNNIPYKQVSMGALRVSKFLELKNQLNLVNINNKNCRIFSNGYLSLWQGKGSRNIKHTSLTETNNSSLIIEIKNNKNFMLLPGDCEYLCLPDNLDFKNKIYRYLVVPHHCSKMDTSLVNIKSSLNNNLAIISVSKDNEKRPELNHLNYLMNNCNYNISLTQDAHYFYVINI
ncbi:hypothetical protein ACQPUI_17730 [Clostridium butyricum]|uniref:hypothetical protein n=1 Tax=Clostridium butyricum TaxID=1492 RepID=UPI003D3272DE